MSKRALHDLLDMDSQQVKCVPLISDGLYLTYRNFNIRESPLKLLTPSISVPLFFPHCTGFVFTVGWSVKSSLYNAKSVAFATYFQDSAFAVPGNDRSTLSTQVSRNNSFFWRTSEADGVNLPRLWVRQLHSANHCGGGGGQSCHRHPNGRPPLRYWGHKIRCLHGTCGKCRC